MNLRWRDSVNYFRSYASLKCCVVEIRKRERQRERERQRDREIDREKQTIQTQNVDAFWHQPNYMSIDTSALHVAHYFRFNTVLIYTCRYRTDSHMEEAKNINDSIILRKLPKSVYSCTCASDRRLKLTEVIKACDHFICYYFVCPFPSYRMGIGKIMMYCMYMVI